jgi:hypothetical protein
MKKRTSSDQALHGAVPFIGISNEKSRLVGDFSGVSRRGIPGASAGDLPLFWKNTAYRMAVCSVAATECVGADWRARTAEL